MNIRQSEILRIMTDAEAIARAKAATDHERPLDFTNRLNFLKSKVFALQDLTS